MRTRLNGGAGRRLARFSLLLGLVAALALWSGTSVAHAAPAATSTVADCTQQGSATTSGTLGYALANAAGGDTITFGCSGTIPITSTISITQNLTLDGSGQSVTLSGGGSVQVLSVNSGVSFTLTALTLAHGSAGKGGGLDNNGGTVTISNSTIANNYASVFGGGVVNDGTMTISNSTIANNSANFGSGGILNNGGGTMTISNSTIFGNGTRVGGGIDNFGTLTVGNSTIVRNSANLGGGLYVESGVAHVAGSIVAFNSGANCKGTITDQGYNLDSGTTCGFTGTGDQQNVTDPKLAAGLADNGGPTQTLALLAGSPAIDQIPAASCPATDQRGVARPDAHESACDIGAYEFVDPDDDLALKDMPANFTTDATGPQGAVVTYTPPTVVDEDDPLPTVSCTPASGSTFAMGTTTVTCTATDGDDTNSPVSGSFTVTVRDASAQLIRLSGIVDGLGLDHGPQTAFDSQLQAVQADLAAGNSGQACSDLASFSSHVKAQSGKQLTADQASSLLASAQQIQNVIGC